MEQSVILIEQSLRHYYSNIEVTQKVKYSLQQQLKEGKVI